MKIERMIDANLNRVSEGLRVIEDCLRFVYEDQGLQEQVRHLKHKVRKSLDGTQYLLGRNALEDVGLEVSQASGLDHKTHVKDLLTANFKRVQEGLRSIEEALKILGEGSASKEYEALRFKAYTLEKECAYLTVYPQTDLYAILCEALSGGRRNEDVARELVEAGIKVIQYREKDKTKRERLKECEVIREITKAHGCFFIVNDDLDIAISVEADGLHLGQDDLPIEYARRMAPHLTIGVSTHNPEQALEAIRHGADYIGVGPVYPTQTKAEVEASEGLNYVKWVHENIKIPFVTIGGIKRSNIKSVQDHGASCFAMISELVSASNIQECVEETRDLLKIKEV